jgi:hypothetical protein
MTSSSNAPAAPLVARRPEIVQVVRDVGLGAVGADDGYERLRAIVCEYLPSAASLRHGEVVGFLLAWELFPPGPPPTRSVGAARVDIPPDQPDRARRALQEAWVAAAEMAASALAADRGVWSLISEVFLNCWEPGIREGYEAIHAARLSSLFPPGPII